MRTVQATVAFKRGIGELPEVEVFNHPVAAYAFAMNIEINGGVAIVSISTKVEPLTSVYKLKFDSEE